MKLGVPTRIEEFFRGSRSGNRTCEQTLLLPMAEADLLAGMTAIAAGRNKDHSSSMSKLVLETARWLFALFSIASIAAAALLDIRSGPCIGLYVLFLLFGALAAMLSLELPFPGYLRKMKR